MDRLEKMLTDEISKELQNGGEFLNNYDSFQNNLMRGVTDALSIIGAVIGLGLLILSVKNCINIWFKYRRENREIQQSEDL